MLLKQSAWVARRIGASSHANPVFVILDDNPIRVRGTIEWHLTRVPPCGSRKQRFSDSLEDAKISTAGGLARGVYRTRLTKILS